jgi:hypothetical protein
LISAGNIRASGGRIYLASTGNYDYLEINHSGNGHQLRINISGYNLDFRPSLDNETAPGIYWNGSRVVPF